MGLGWAQVNLGSLHARTHTHTTLTLLCHHTAPGLRNDLSKLHWIKIKQCQLVWKINYSNAFVLRYSCVCSVNLIFSEASFLLHLGTCHYFLCSPSAQSLLEVGSPPTFWTDEWLEANFPHVISDFNFRSNVPAADPLLPQRKLPLTGPRPGSELEQVEQMFRGPRVTFSLPDIGACIWLGRLTSLGDEPLIKSIGSLYLDWPTAVDNLWSIWKGLELISGYLTHIHFIITVELAAAEPTDGFH